MDVFKDCWKCPVCEFMNKGDQDSCLMCNTPRKEEGEGEGERGLKDGVKGKRSINKNDDDDDDNTPPPSKKPKTSTISWDKVDRMGAGTMAGERHDENSKEKEKKKKGKTTKQPFNKAFKAELRKLESFFLSPAACTDRAHGAGNSKKVLTVMSPKEIQEMLAKYVPNINELYDRRHTCPVTTLIIKTYNNGLPLYEGVPAIKEHTKHAIRYIFDTLGDKEQGHSDNEKRVCLRRLAEAFTSCQAGQARELDAVYGGLIGRSLDLRGQVLSVVDEQKQRVLDMVTQKLHPDAWTSMDPTHQAPHIESAYTQLFGQQLGLRGTGGAGADYCMAAVPLREAAKAEKEFRKLFSAEETLETIVQDVNQQSKDADRAISRKDLSKWAGDASVNGGFDPYSIFYDEDNKDDYPDDTKPSEENKYQPFISKKVALNMLLKLFGL